MLDIKRQLVSEGLTLTYLGGALYTVAYEVTYKVLPTNILVSVDGTYLIWFNENERLYVLNDRVAGKTITGLMKLVSKRKWGIINGKDNL